MGDCEIHGELDDSDVARRDAAVDLVHGLGDAFVTAAAPLGAADARPDMMPPIVDQAQWRGIQRIGECFEVVSAT